MNRPLKQIESSIRHHQDILKKYQENPPQIEHEYKAKQMSERVIAELEQQYKSIMRDD